MPQPVIQISHLSHAYGQHTALRDVSLEVAAGEIFAFLGPNGSGKTTLFRILTTFLPAPPGAVTMLGRDLAVSRALLRRELGVVFQAPSVDRQLTAEENIRHHGHLYGLRGAELSERAEAMLRRFGLWDRRREYVQTFSGGMRRRVELAKGLLTRPRILLMDEPATGLDPAARIELWAALKSARDEDGVTILVTTHLLDEAERCDRLAILESGRVLACDSPAHLKEQIGGDVITLTSQDPRALAAAVHQRFGIAPEQVGATLRIERPRAHEFVPQLVEEIPGLIESVSIGKPTLEDVFIHVTGHRLTDEREEDASR